MAKITILLFNLKPSSHSLFHDPRPLTPPIRTLFSRHFSRTTNTPKRNTLINFSLSESDSEPENNSPSVKNIDKQILPPPYDPFNKPPLIQQPDDPTNLQEVFHKIRTEGLHNHAVKMFDALSKHGLTHEALDLFSQIKDKGQMPDVISHTAVIEAYADAGKPKEALKVYTRMLACGVVPNAYTYIVVVKTLCGSGEWKMVREGMRCFVKMMEKGIRPNAETCVAVFEGVVEYGKEEEGRELVVKMKDCGFDVDETGVKEILKSKRGPVSRSVMNILVGK